MERLSGSTTRQMEDAPQNAIFIWCNSDTYYPKRLAEKLGRKDLRIKSPDWLDYGWRGLYLSGVILDHAVNLTRSQWQGYWAAKSRVKLK